MKGVGGVQGAVAVIAGEIRGSFGVIFRRLVLEPCAEQEFAKVADVLDALILGADRCRVEARYRDRTAGLEVVAARIQDKPCSIPPSVDGTVIRP